MSIIDKITPEVPHDMDYPALPFEISRAYLSTRIFANIMKGASVLVICISSGQICEPRLGLGNWIGDLEAGGESGVLSDHVATIYKDKFLMPY